MTTFVTPHLPVCVDTTLRHMIRHSTSCHLPDISRLRLPRVHSKTSRARKSPRDSQLCFSESSRRNRRMVPRFSNQAPIVGTGTRCVRVSHRPLNIGQQAVRYSTRPEGRVVCVYHRLSTSARADDRNRGLPLASKRVLKGRKGRKKKAYQYGRA